MAQKTTRVLSVFNDYLQYGGERAFLELKDQALKFSPIEHSILKVDNSELASGPLMKRASLILGNPKLERQLKSEIDSKRPDVIHAENLFPYLGPAFTKIMQETGIPWVRTVQNFRQSCIAGTHMRNSEPCFQCKGKIGSAPAIIHSCYRGDRLATLGALTSRSLTDFHSGGALPQKNLFTSRYMMDQYDLALPSLKGNSVVPTPVHFPAHWKGSMVKQWDVAFVGRLEPEKGAELVLNLAQECPEMRIVAVGTGSFKERFEKADTRMANFRYLGELSRVSAIDIFANSNFALVPSVWAEPFGRVAVEAISAGAIPLVSSAGGLGEIVRKLGAPELGIVSGVLQEWSDKLRGFAAKPSSQLDEFRSSLFEAGKAQFGLEAVGRVFSELYEGLAQANPH